MTNKLNLCFIIGDNFIFIVLYSKFQTMRLRNKAVTVPLSEGIPLNILRFLMKSTDIRVCLLLILGTKQIVSEIKSGIAKFIKC